jgi:hypothetical protein
MVDPIGQLKLLNTEKPMEQLKTTPTDIHSNNLKTPQAVVASDPLISDYFKMYQQLHEAVDEIKNTKSVMLKASVLYHASFFFIELGQLTTAKILMQKALDLMNPTENSYFYHQYQGYIQQIEELIVKQNIEIDAHQKQMLEKPSSVLSHLLTGVWIIQSTGISNALILIC